MSLRVWLPLTKDLRNQGTLGPTIINVQSGCNVDATGKLGQCYTNTGTSANVANTINFSASQFSVCAWVRLNTRRNNWCKAFGMAGNGTYLGFACEHSNGNGLGFHYYKTIDGTNTNIFDTYPINVTTGEWHHFTMCYDGIKYYIYHNGSLIASNNARKTNIDCNMTTLYLFGGVSGNYSQCSLNDVRIYDHALSPLEVKEISQGLILHYPLNRGGWGQENLIITNSMAPTSGTSGWNSAGTGWANSNVVSAGASNGHAIRCTFSGTSAVTGGIHHPTGNTKGDLTDGGTYTLSARLRASKVCTVAFRNELMNTTTNTIVTTEWKVYTFTSTIDNSKTYHSNIMYVQNNTTYPIETNMWIECDWIKLEEGSIATPWCPNSSDVLAKTLGLNSTTVVDCSGFGYDGTETGTLTTTSDSPRYDVSTKIAAASSGIKIPNFSIDNIWSLSLWFKYPSQDSSGWKALVILNNNGRDADLQLGNYINCSGNQIQYSANGKYTTGVTFTYGDWHHIVNTYDGTTLRCYLDGVYKTSVTPGQTLLRTNLGIGCRATAIDFSSISNSATNAQISDVRIYATALSAADVLDLYHTSVSIDNLYNLHSYEFTEDGLTKIHKNGVTKSDNFNESVQVNTITSFGYTPAANITNSCASQLACDFTPWKNSTYPIAIKVELDVVYTKFTAGTGGSFAMYFQGSNYKNSTDVYAWEGANYVTTALNNKQNLGSLVLTSAGTYHYDVTTVIPESWLANYSKSGLSIRTNFSDGTGHIDIKNIKVTINGTPTHFGNEYIMTDEFIEK